MAGREHQAQEVVADIIVDRSLEIRHGPFLPGLKLVTEFSVLALERLVPARGR